MKKSGRGKQERISRIREAAEKGRALGKQALGNTEKRKKLISAEGFFSKRKNILNEVSKKSFSGAWASLLTAYEKELTKECAAVFEGLQEKEKLLMFKESRKNARRLEHELMSIEKGEKIPTSVLKENLRALMARNKYLEDYADRKGDDKLMRALENDNKKLRAADFIYKHAGRESGSALEKKKLEGAIKGLGMIAEQILGRGDAKLYFEKVREFKEVAELRIMEKGANQGAGVPNRLWGQN